MRQVLLFFFQRQTFWKKNIQNIHWTCLNVQLNYRLVSYFYMQKSKLYRKSVNLAVSIIFRHVFMAFRNLLHRFYIPFKSVALW